MLRLQKYTNLCNYSETAVGQLCGRRPDRPCHGRVRVRVTLRLAVYGKFILAPSPLRITTKVFFFATELLRLCTLRNIFSDQRMGVSLMNILGLSSNVRIAHIACLHGYGECIFFPGSTQSDRSDNLEQRISNRV
jgi:hypothetical protein